MKNKKSASLKAPIIGISRHRISTDGQGVTTLVAFHGCPLKCGYCLNEQCHDDVEKFTYYTPAALYKTLKIDDPYFRATEGGVTFGGGEPLLYPEFIKKFSELCGDDWRITVETSLNVDAEAVRMLTSVVDEWIVDIKTFDSDKYHEYTHGDLSRVVENLTLLKELTDEDMILIRIPVIPGVTDEQDAEATRLQLESAGFSRFDLFRYKTDFSQENSPEESENHQGKELCELLKTIRRELAEINDIKLREHECTHKGDCPGTCPMCDQSLKTLATKLKAHANPATFISEALRDKILSDNYHTRDILDGNSKMPEDGPEVDGEMVLGQAPIFESEFYKRVPFLECAIAGMSYHVEYEDGLWDELEVGTELALVRDRHNKHDRNAVAVALSEDYDGDPDDFDFDFILGYIPRNENAQIAAMLDAGYEDKFETKISSYKREGSINSRVRISIKLLSKEPIDPDANLLRFVRISSHELYELREELSERGTAHFYWGGFPPHEKFKIEPGDEIILANCSPVGVTMYLMKVLLKGEEALKFVDPNAQIEDAKDLYVLTNVAGPIYTEISSLSFLDPDSLRNEGVFRPLDPDEGASLRELIGRHLRKFL